MDQILEQSAYFSENETLKQAFDAAGVSILIVNKQRQIVFSNKAFQSLLHLDSGLPLLGKRPGEAINCINAEKNEAGCGTSECCKQCGATNVVLKAMLLEKEAKGEVIIRTRGGGVEIPLNLMESVAPFREFFIITLLDVSDSMRRRELERIFFHDIINASGGVSGLLSLLKDEVPESVKPDIELAATSFSNMLEEILFHKKLSEAENDELQCDFAALNSGDIIQAVSGLYRSHKIAHGKEIAVENNESLDFRSDGMLLGKVLGNILKNALEATIPGGTVTMGCRRAGTGGVEFWVHNDGVIPPDVQNRLFQRSFSTKGRGRGLGTYSVKLFVEKYLNGSVEFLSNEAQGTIFSLKL